MTSNSRARALGSVYFFAILVVSGIGRHAEAVPTAAFMGLGGPTSANGHNQAWGISADGSSAVGWAGGSAFRWRLGTGMQFVGSGNAYGASEDGSVIVGQTAGGAAFRWTQSTGAQLIGPLPGNSGFANRARAVSGDGSMVAGSAKSQPNPSLDSDSFLWTAATGTQSLGDVPGGRPGPSDAFAMSLDGSVIVGQTIGPLFLEAYRWTESTGMMPLTGIPPGFMVENATAVSADGSTVVGYARSPNTNPSWLEAYSWTETGGFVPLGDLPGGVLNSFAWAVSGDGSIIVGEGATGDSVDDKEAFIWDAAHGMRNLRELLISDFGLDLDGWILNAARGISADGNTIVGYGVNPQGYQESWVAVIPEPSSTALAVILIATQVIRRRRGTRHLK